MPSSVFRCISVFKFRVFRCLPISDSFFFFRYCAGRDRVQGSVLLPNYRTLEVRPGGLEITVVLWPQSTRTCGGPPDSATWWSGGVFFFRGLLLVSYDLQLSHFVS